MNKIWNFADEDIKKPIELKELEVLGELDVNAKLIILDDVKDHLIPHRSGKKTTHEMWKVL